jgi:NAD(P)-dependent dehydrogenase (short-subunit alcohol dehydrogenase family)
MKTIVITGVTSGIGRALMTHFTKKHHVIGIARDEKKLAQLKSSLQGSFELIQADLSRFEDIERAAHTIQTNYPKGIDVLINNAASVPGTKVLSAHAFEMQFQVNHLAVVLMTHRLLPLLSLKQGMVLTTSSNAHRAGKFKKNDLEGHGKYALWRVYGTTKLYNIYFTKLFNDLVKQNSGVIAHAIHPGLVKTELGTKDIKGSFSKIWKWLTRFGITPEESVLTYHDLVEGNISIGDYWDTSKPGYLTKLAQNYDNALLLWERTNAILNITW